MSVPLEAVLFDLDGTLLDSIELIVASFEHTMVAEGLPHRSRAEILAELGRPLLDTFPEWSGDPSRTDQLIDTYRAWNLTHHDELARPYEGIPAAVEGLAAQGLRMGVVTSKLSGSARRGLEVCGIAAHMEVLVACDHVEQHKPHPAPVLAGAAQLGVPPERCVYVGDAPVDILAGRAAGARTAGATWGVEDDQPLRETRPDWWLTRTEQLLELARSPEPRP